MKIATVGLWHLGEVYSTCLAHLGHQIIGIDPDPLVVKNLNLGIPPLAETGLLPWLKKHLKEKNISFTTDFAAVSSCQVIWFTLDTPVDSQDRSDINKVLSLIKKSIPHLAPNTLIIISSQIPAGTSHQIIDLIKKKRPTLKFGLAYAPENLRLGNALNCFMQPEKIVIGADTPNSSRKAMKILEKIKTQFIITDLPTAEMIKHATNSFLATSLSFINDIADVCEIVGADINQVASTLKLDPRIGPNAYLGAGLGFSGGTLGRDLVSLSSIAAKYHLSLPIIKAAFTKNKTRQNIIIKKLRQQFRQLKNQPIAILGLTYKAGTSTLRRSLPLEVAKKLIKLGARVHLYQSDIKTSQIPPSIRRHSRFFTNPYQATTGVKALLLTTPLPELNKLQFKRLTQNMSDPKLIIDGYNLLSDQESIFKKFNIIYSGVGR